MEPPPSTRCSEPAAAAMRHLQGVEKQLQNEGLVFNKETVQHLENAINAIKELEEKRKQTIELWEEETIKNCNLRVRVKKLPEIVMKEFDELVAAAHRFRYHKLGELKLAINETTIAVNSTYSNQELYEEQNVTLCEEQAELWVKHQEFIEQVNQHLEEKHTINIEINDLHNMKKEEEEEIIMVEDATEELKILMSREEIEFKEKKRNLNEELADLKRKLEVMKHEITTKREEYSELVSELRGLQDEETEYTQSNSDLRNTLAELFKQMRQKIKEFEEKKTMKEELLKKRVAIETKPPSEDEDFDDERDELLRRIKELEEKLELANRCYEKLKNENDLLNTQLQTFLDEEERARAERDKFTEEFEYLTNRLTEKLDNLGKRFEETKIIEEEVDRLQELFDAQQDTYARELAHLEDVFQNETNKREKFQNELVDITARFKKLTDEHDELLVSSKQKRDAAKRLLLELTEQNEQLQKENATSEKTLKNILAKLHKKEAEYKKRDAKLLAEIKKLEDEYNSTQKLLQEKEEELKVNIPLSEELKMELEEKSTSYAKQSEMCAELQEEERFLSKSIDRSLKEINKLKRQKVQAKSDLKKYRELAFNQQQTFACSLKFMERDNYEVNRILYILNAENDRLRAGIAFLKEDISSVDHETKVFQSERHQIHKNRKALYELFIKKWIKDEHLHKMFLKHQHDAMKFMEEHIRQSWKRNHKVDWVHDGLQMNYEEMESLLESKSTQENGNE